uniref:Uncharacterized protein n=1 Tax=Leersia perrieri TaxID=77586 RepID=A0A0D9WDP2_9ORYZ
MDDDMLTELYDSTDVVDIDELVDSMRADLNRRTTLDECRKNGNKCGLICKIVHRVRLTDRNVYEPSVLSIGPYHHSESQLIAMETEKWICADYILKLNRNGGETRGSYGEDTEMDSKEFLQMLLLDSCFILVYLGGMRGLCRDKHTQEVSDDGPGIQEDGDTVEWYNSSAVYDLLLLENQIPFFIVRAIYQLFSRDTVATTPLLTSDISEFMEGILYHFPKVITEANRPGDFYHLLHLCHMYLKPGQKLDEQHHGHAGKSHCFDYIYYFGKKVFCFGREQNMYHELNKLYSPQLVNRWRRAVNYHEAGIEFRKREFDEEDPHSLLDIKFRKGVMEIPCLLIDDKSSLLFRNLVALEQTCPQVGEDITAYIVLMSQLISTAADVALLAQKGIIVHQMESDEEVSTLFTKLFEHVGFDYNGEYYLKSLFYVMEAHYQSRLNRWMALLWHKHFSNPWLGFAAITSAFIVLCKLFLHFCRISDKAIGSIK